MVGATWQAGTLRAGLHIEVRARSNGTWSDWSALEPSDMGPDPGSADDRAAGASVASEPVWVGQADAVQTRVRRADGRLAFSLRPRGLRLTLVDPGTSSADAHVGSPTPLGGAVASAAQSQPVIYTRAQWGADESLRTNQCPEGPDYNSTIKVGFVHHTDTPNGYSSSDVPSILRSIYAYHVNGNGWCDIGYNYLIDRFGRTWEGRYGGITRAVVGAHTGGFNKDSFGVSAIGTYTSTAPPSGMVSAYERLFAWKLGLYHRDPTSTDVLVSAGGGTDKWPTGTRVRFNVMAGHRDAGSTSCPGNALYGQLPTMRRVARSFMGVIAPGLTDFTGDGRTDISVYRPSDQHWYVRGISKPYRWGLKDDIPVPGDYTGDGTTDYAVYRPSNQYWYVHGITKPARWGLPNDIPVPGDYTGDGVTDLAVYRPSNQNWYIRGISSPLYYGTVGDIPVPGDYIGDMGVDAAMYRPSNGTWYVHSFDGSPNHNTQLGTPGDRPVPADYTGDGKTDPAVWRPTTGGWYVNGQSAVAQVGKWGDVPVPGSYLRNGLSQPATYRPSTGQWFLGSSAYTRWGLKDDEPMPLPWVLYQHNNLPTTVGTLTSRLKGTLGR
jgi:hypothetical protein